jgi:hypothetical protein
MTDISIQKIENQNWFVYKRLKDAKDRGKGKHYYHCTCKTETQHGAVDIRVEQRHPWLGHNCFQPIPAMLARRLKPRETQSRFEADNDTRLSDMTTVDQAALVVTEKWILLQNHLDLSFTAATSKELYDFGYALISVAQHFPSVQPEELFKKVSRETYKKMHKQFAEKRRKENHKILEGKSVSLLFDASKVGRKHLLISFVSHPSFERPLFFRLVTSPRKQEEYARVAAELILELKRSNVSVGSVCVDGLQAQVNALSGKYKGVSFFSFFIFIVLFELLEGRNLC